VTTIAFFDIDGTLITENVWDHYLAQPKIAPQKRGVYRRFLPTYMARKAKLLPEARFREAWVTQMARLIKGWSTAQVDELFDRIVLHDIGDQFRADVKVRVQQHLARGERVILASGMFAGLAERFARLLGAETGIGTKLAFSGGVCTGKLDGRGCAGEQKPLFMKAFLGGDLGAVTGYADSYSDVPMLSAVGHPVATYPDEELRAYAQARQWEIFP
jgi:alcohol-forming fatty acyl-CoA reductase